MAIRPNNGTLFKGFTFDGIDSKDFGVYLTQEAAFAAPVRDVEMFEIAGRNGAYALDKGRFLNIEVTYKAAITATDEASFAAGISALRNALCSRVGYKRLEDDYNPDEYRLAIYKSGLEVAAADILKAGEFDLVFDCKPQRYLKSGETPQTITSGDVVTNPTLFDSRPLLAVSGYGDINLGGAVIDVNNDPYGDILLANKTAFSAQSLSVSLDDAQMSKMNSGDTIRVNSGSTITLQFDNKYKAMYKFLDLTASVTGTSGIDTTRMAIIQTSTPLYTRAFSITTGGFYFSTGTADTHTIDVSFSLRYSIESGGAITTTTWDADFTIYIGYRSENNTVFLNRSNPSSTVANISFHLDRPNCYYQPIYGESTKTPVGEDIYIDLDIGEAYVDINGEVASANSIITLPAELPTLKAGANTITYENTINSLEIVPRWWKV